MSSAAETRAKRQTMTAISARSRRPDQGGCVDAAQELVGFLGGDHRRLAAIHHSSGRAPTRRTQRSVGRIPLVAIPDQDSSSFPDRPAQAYGQVDFLIFPDHALLVRGQANRAEPLQHRFDVLGCRRFSSLSRPTARHMGSGIDHGPHFTPGGFDLDVPSAEVRRLATYLLADTLHHGNIRFRTSGRHGFDQGRSRNSTGPDRV
jgi:hypothetical protein